MEKLVSLSLKELSLELEKCSSERFLIKALMDKFYRKLLLKNRDKDLLVRAGFFDDGLNKKIDLDVGFLSTPVHKISPPKTLNPVVLVSTGGFNPFHSGHLYMMESAREELERNGLEVIGGYLSPSHDDYVLNKYATARKHHITERISELQNEIKNHPYLMVDPWEGLYTSQPINFTEVVERLEKYLYQHLKIKVSIAYVVGADNGDFSYAFLNTKHKAVVVNRDSASQKFRELKEKLAQENNVYFVDYNPYSKYSSRLEKKSKPIEQVFLPYLVRNDLVESKILSHTVTTSRKIIDLIAQHTSQPVVELNLMDQEQFAGELTQSANVINLDPLVSGGIKLGLSRLFPISSDQSYSQRLIPRPHSPSILEQIKNIPPGKYTLLEDDVASGFTVGFVKSLLPKNVDISEIKTLTEHSFYLKYPKHTPFKFFDIVDLRDFIIGVPHGGLVVELPNLEVARGVYTLPFVNLVTRAKMTPEKAWSFSKAVWEINESIFRENKLVVKDLDLYSQKLFLYLGYKSKTKVYKICQDFRRRFK